MLAIKPIDSFSTSFVQKRAGKIALSGMRVVSKDRTTLTISSKGTNAKGEQVDNVVVFDRR